MMQYNRFWQDSALVPISWLGLLFSVLCLSTQFQNSETRTSTALTTSTPSQADATTLINIYRERIVQSLVLARYSRGGPFIIETMTHYLVAESFLRLDSDIEIWLVLGTLVQIGKKKNQRLSIYSWLDVGSRLPFLCGKSN